MNEEKCHSIATGSGYKSISAEVNFFMTVFSGNFRVNIQMNCFYILEI